MNAEAGPSRPRTGRGQNKMRKGVADRLQATLERAGMTAEEWTERANNAVPVTMKSPVTIIKEDRAAKDFAEYLAAMDNATDLEAASNAYLASFKDAAFVKQEMLKGLMLGWLHFVGITCVGEISSNPHLAVMRSFNGHVWNKAAAGSGSLEPATTSNDDHGVIISDEDKNLCSQLPPPAPDAKPLSLVTLEGTVRTISGYFLRQKTPLPPKLCADVIACLRYCGRILGYFVTTSKVKHFLTRRDRSEYFAAYLAPREWSSSKDLLTTQHFSALAVLSIVLHTGTRLQSLLRDSINKTFLGHQMNNQVNRYVKWSMLTFRCYGYTDKGDIQLSLSFTAPGAKSGAARGDEHTVGLNEAIGSFETLDRDYVLFIFALGLARKVFPKDTAILLNRDKGGLAHLIKNGKNSNGEVSLAIQAVKSLEDEAVFTRAIFQKDHTVKYTPLEVLQLRDDMDFCPSAVLGWKESVRPSDFRRAFAMSASDRMAGHKVTKQMQHRSGDKRVARSYYDSTFPRHSMAAQLDGRSLSMLTVNALEGNTSKSVDSGRASKLEKGKKNTVRAKTERSLPRIAIETLTFRSEELKAILVATERHIEASEGEVEDDKVTEIDETHEDLIIKDGDLERATEALSEALAWCDCEVEEDDLDKPLSLIDYADAIISTAKSEKTDDTIVNPLLEAIKSSPTPCIDAILWILEQHRRELAIARGLCRNCGEEHLTDSRAAINYETYQKCVCKTRKVVFCTFCPAIVPVEDADVHTRKCLSNHCERAIEQSRPIATVSIKYSSMYDLPYFRLGFTGTRHMCSFEECIAAFLTGEGKRLVSTKSAMANVYRDAGALSRHTAAHILDYTEKKLAVRKEYFVDLYIGKSSQLKFLEKRDKHGRIHCGVYSCDKTFDSSGARLKHLALQEDLLVFVNEDGARPSAEDLRNLLSVVKDTYPIWPWKKQAGKGLYVHPPMQPRYLQKEAPARLRKWERGTVTFSEGNKTSKRRPSRARNVTLEETSSDEGGEDSEEETDSDCAERQGETDDIDPEEDDAKDEAMTDAEAKPEIELRTDAKKRGKQNRITSDEEEAEGIERPRKILREKSNNQALHFQSPLQL
jgi:hypothetical protein